MSRYEDYPQRGPRGRHESGRDERRDPYEGQRQVRTFGDDDAFAAEHPWRAAHPQRDFEGSRSPRWSEQPARYGGGYGDDELWSTPRGTRDDARYGLDTDDERAYGRAALNEDRRHRAQGYGPWQGQRDDGRRSPGQNNSGYEAARAYGQGQRQDDAGSDYARASWTQEHDYEGPRYGATRWPQTPRHRDTGSQYAHTDTYGGAGFRQQGKRYWFDEGDQRSQFRGTRPRNYERSDERLRELACERLTDADLDASDVEVKVSQGTVTLEGSVPARWMKHQAEDIVDDLGGVQDIQNHLRVSRGSAGQAATHGSSPAPGVAATPGTASSTTGSSSSGSTSGAGGQGGDIAGRSRH
jgi:hypothetical protein